MTDVDVLVVGAGISGLATAYQLAQAGLSVRVLEGSDRVGGKIDTVNKQGYRLEQAASMVMDFRSELDPFLRGCGLYDRKQPRRAVAKRFIAIANRLVEVPTGFRDLLQTPLFSTAGKLRMLAEPLIPRSASNNESVADFVRRRLGQEFLDQVFEPYVGGPLAADVAKAEAASTLPRLVALEQRYGSLAVGAIARRLMCKGRAARPEVFSFPGGMAALPQMLAGQGGFSVQRGTPVCEIQPVKNGWITRGLDGERLRTFNSRQLVLSTPAHVSASLVSPVNGRLGRLLRGIDYAPIRVVYTGFRRQDIRHELNGSGFLLPRGNPYHANGCQWMSSLFAHQAPAGKVLLSTYLGGARNPSAALENERYSVDSVMQMLHELMGAKAEPEMLDIKSHRRGLPLYHGRYAQRMGEIDECVGHLSGLHLVANYRGGVSVRDRILCAQRVAQQIAGQLKQTHSASVRFDVSELAPAALAVR